MSLARITTWSLGDILTATALNAEFNNLLNNAMAMVSPATTDLDLNTHLLINGIYKHDPITFAAQDATPDVSGGTVFKTANVSATTITMFDGAVDGQTIWVTFNDANTTIDFSATNLVGNSSIDWTPVVGDSLQAVFVNPKWYCRISGAPVAPADGNQTSVTATGSTTARLLEDRFAEEVNVKNFGAVGDGVTDDTAAFTAAAAVGLPIYVPATSTSYLTGSFTVDGVKMFGEGTLKWKTSADLTWITLDNGASLEGLSFDGNASVQSHAGPKGIFVSTSPSTSIDQCDFTNFRKYIIITDEDNGSMYGRVTNCRFHASGTIANANAISICSSNWIVSGNHFEGGWGSDAHMVRTGNFTASTVPVENTVISGNFFTNTPYSGVVIELYTQHISITGNTFDTLEQAIKVESTGGTQRYIDIIGNTFVDIGAAGVALNLTGDYVNFSHNTLLTVAGPVDVGNNATVSHNIMNGVGDATHGSIEQDSSYTVSTIIGNVILNAPYDGIIVAGGSGVISGNRITTTTRRGINLTGDKHSVTGNYIEGTVDGIVVGSTTSNSLVSNNVVLTVSGTAYSISTGADSLTNYVDAASNVGYAGKIHSYTIDVAGAIEIGRSDKFVSVDTFAAAATDDLDTITAANAYIGQIITLRTASAARVVTAKDGTNLKLAGDFVMDSTEDSLTLLWHGTFWQELARSSNS